MEEEHTRGNFSEALLDLGDERPNVGWWSGPKDQAMPPIPEVWVTFRVFYFRQNLVNGDTAEIRGKELGFLKSIAVGPMRLVALLYPGLPQLLPHVIKSAVDLMSLTASLPQASRRPSYGLSELLGVFKPERSSKV